MVDAVFQWLLYRSIQVNFTWFLLLLFYAILLLTSVNFKVTRMLVDFFSHLGLKD